MKHEEIEEAMFFVDPDTNNVIRVDKGNAAATPQERCVMVFGPRITVEPSFVELLIAAPMMYQTLTHQYKALQLLLNMADAQPQTPELSQLVTMITEMQNAVLLAQQVAQFGIEKVANSLDADKRSK